MISVIRQKYSIVRKGPGIISILDTSYLVLSIKLCKYIGPNKFMQSWFSIRAICIVKRGSGEFLVICAFSLVGVLHRGQNSKQINIENKSLNF